MAASDAECFFGRWIEFDDIALMIYRNQTIKRRFENRAFQSLARAQFLVDALLLRYVLQGVEPAQLAVRAGCAEWFHCLPDMNPRAVGPTQLVFNLPALVPDGGLDRRAAKQPPIVWMDYFHPRASAPRQFVRLHADQLRQGVRPAFESPIRACDHVRELRHDLRLAQARFALSQHLLCTLALGRFHLQLRRMSLDGVVHRRVLVQHRELPRHGVRDPNVLVAESLLVARVGKVHPAVDPVRRRDWNAKKVADWRMPVRQPLAARLILRAAHAQHGSPRKERREQSRAAAFATQ